MGRFVEGADRSQLTLLLECLEDWVSEDNAVHVIDAFIEALDLHGLGWLHGRGKARLIRRETSSSVLCRPARPGRGRSPRRRFEEH